MHRESFVNILGVKAFTLPLSEYVRAGRWMLHVEVETAEFSAPIEISPGASKINLLTNIGELLLHSKNKVKNNLKRQINKQLIKTNF